jgi:hypothetical protein
MSNYSSDGEVYGAKALYAAIVIGAALLLVGVVWSPAPAPAKTGNPAIGQVVVTASDTDKTAG